MKAKDFLEKPVENLYYLNKMSNEIARFTRAMESMNQSQANDVVEILGMVLKAVEKLSEVKAVPPPVQPINVKITEPKESDYLVRVTKRDRAGLIDEVSIERLP